MDEFCVGLRRQRWLQSRKHSASNNFCALHHAWQNSLNHVRKCQGALQSAIAITRG